MGCFLLTIILITGLFSYGGISVCAGTESEIPDYIEKATVNGVEYLLFDSGEDMAWLRQHILSGGDTGTPDGSQVAEGNYCTHNIMLTADIDMSDYNGLDSEDGTLHGEGYNNGMYSGIGYAQNGLGYSGIFDGNGHSITNVDVYNNELVGPKGLLFNLTKDTTIQNLVIQGKVETTRYTGGLIGRSTGSLTIKNVIVNADALLFNGNANAVGGLVGQLGAGRTYTKDSVTIENCGVVGRLVSETESNPVGGLVGHIYGGFDVSIKNCYAAAEVNGANTAGIIGSNGTGTLQIDNSFYLDGMSDVPLAVMTGSTADASPVGPDSNFIDVTKMSETTDENVVLYSSVRK